MTIQEKLEKETKKLDALMEQKKELDKKIQKAQENVSKYNSMLKQKSYEETEEILSANNLTLDMIKDALKNGDLLSLQMLMEESKNKSEAVQESDYNEYN